MRVDTRRLFKQPSHVLVAMYNVSNLNAVIIWEVEDDVSGVGDCVAAQPFGE